MGKNNYSDEFSRFIDEGRQWLLKRGYLSDIDELMHYGVKGMKWGVRKSKKTTNQRRGKYDPPYSAKQVKEKYGDEIFKRLRKDPAHKWRMDTGIELIHKEPTLRELLRIRRNWSLMSEEQKMLSDRKSIELFGMTNIEHFNSLLPDYFKIKQ